MFPGLGAFWLIRCSALGATVHDAAHHAFMTLPPYAKTREGETPEKATDEADGGKWHWTTWARRRKLAANKSVQEPVYLFVEFL